MKTIRDYFNYLLANYSNKLAKSDVYEIFEQILKKSYVELILDLDYKLNDEEIEKIKKAISQLDMDYPIAYITKRKYFYKNFFYVNENVLIPRDDTEKMVNAAIDFLKANYLNEDPIVYDICTGSGAIGLSIGYELPNAKVYLSDISNDALEVAKDNSVLLRVNNAEFLQGDYLKPFKKIKKANLIISNPPYIEEGDLDVDFSVDKYEPKIALYAKDHGLDFYKKMASRMYSLVDDSKKFMILMEFGYKQKDEINSIFKEKLKKDNKIDFIRDNSGNWRYLIIYN